MNQIAIKCQNIKKHYGESENRIEALKGINLDIYRNQLTILAGPSGSGKTTLLSIIATILTPDAGQLILLDEDISGMSEMEKARFRRHRMGIVFQSLFLIPTLTVAENVALPLLIAGESQEAAMEKAKEMLKMMHMEKRAHVSPALLSKGQQQRVAIARAMINESQIILCDEPTSALDHVAGFELMTFLQNLTTTSLKTVLVVTHDRRLFPFANRIVNMIDGQISDEAT